MSEWKVLLLLFLLGCLISVNCGIGSNNLYISSSIQPRDNVSVVATPRITPNETSHVLSVTVRIYCSTPDAQILYSLDGSEPIPGDRTSFTTLSGEPIVVDTIGEVVVNAIALKEGLKNSLMVRKRYTILDRCMPCTFSPPAGTYAGSTGVRLLSDTPGSKIYYSLNCNLPVPAGGFNDGSYLSVLNGGLINIDHEGKNCLSAVVTRPDLANSPLSRGLYYILPKVKNPTFAPDTNVFTISATIMIYCVTPNATIHFTTNGNDPDETSLQILSGDSIVIEGVGAHTIKAMATEASMLPSDISVKVFEILERAGIPSCVPQGGSYVDDISITFHCADNMIAHGNGKVYYTLNTFETPTSLSSSVDCGHSIILKAPGTYFVRAFAQVEGMSPSAIIEEQYVIRRPLFDQFPIKDISVQSRCKPLVNVDIVEKDLNPPYYSSACDKRRVRGRLVTLDNPLGHFDLLEPLKGCQAHKLVLPSVTGRAFHSHQLNYSLYHSYFANISQDEWTTWTKEYQEYASKGCEVVTNAGFFNVSSRTCLGNLVTQGQIIQTTNSHNVNFGIRNGSFYVGYLDEKDIYRCPDEIPEESRNSIRFPVHDDGTSRRLESNFDTLITGILWLVRQGQSYVSESMSTSGDHEDLSGQSTGSMFASVLSARTALGYDRQGRLKLLQIEGETWVRGMSLYELADWAIELGFVSAINLDGGGSATMTLNQTLVSEPSWKCQDPSNTAGYYRCEKEVASVTCVHAVPPPPMTFNQATLTPSSRPSTSFPSSIPTPAPSRIPSSVPTLSQTTIKPSSSTPTSIPTSIPTSLPTSVPSMTPTNFTSSDYNMTAMIKLYRLQIDELQISLNHYQDLTWWLFAALVCSITIHFIMVILYYCRPSKWNRSNRKFVSDPRFSSENEDPIDVEMSTTTSPFSSSSQQHSSEHYYLPSTTLVPSIHASSSSSLNPPNNSPTATNASGKNSGMGKEVKPNSLAVSDNASIFAGFRKNSSVKKSESWQDALKKMNLDLNADSDEDEVDNNSSNRHSNSNSSSSSSSSSSINAPYKKGHNSLDRKDKRGDLNNEDLMMKQSSSKSMKMKTASSSDVKNANNSLQRSSKTKNSSNSSNSNRSNVSSNSTTAANVKYMPIKARSDDDDDEDDQEDVNPFHRRG